MRAEEIMGGRAGPVMERWFIEEIEAVQTRSEPVTARRHFTCHFCMASFVRLTERPRLEAMEPCHCPEYGHPWGQQPTSLLRVPKAPAAKDSDVVHSVPKLSKEQVTPQQVGIPNEYPPRLESTSELMAP